MRKTILSIILLGSSFLSITAQSLNPVSYISASGSADSFNAGYTFAYATSGTPWNGSLISYGGFPINNYDTQISSDYGPGGGKHISFRTKNGDLNIWNPWIELATKGENDFTGKQSISGYLGLGLSEPLNKLHIHGGHGDSRILLHSAGGGADTHQADLMLWASEPGLSYTGVGIGNNIHNFNNPNGGLKLLNTARGGSYIRLLDCAMQFNVVNSVGEDKQVMSINTSGNVGIGTLNPDTKLAVKGTIHSQEVKVDMEGWSDFVFKKEYNLPTLEQVQKHIAEKGHLENIPSEEEVLKNGINLGEMNAKLLQKIEELTLYIIQQEKKSNAQAIQIEALSKENEVFGNLLQRLTTVEEKLKIERNEK